MHATTEVRRRSENSNGPQVAFFFPLQAACVFSAIERFHPSSKPQDLTTILIINEEPNRGGTSKDEVPRSRVLFLREQTGFKIEGRGGVSATTL